VAAIRQDAAGKFKSAVVEFSVTKVGPGVFFALFGAWVLYSSLHTPVAIRENSLVMVGTDSSAVQQLRDYVAELPNKEKRDAALAIINKLGSARPFYYGYQPPRVGPSG
jgi:hypothetical protein